MPITLKKSSLKYKDPEGNMKDIGLPVGGVITDTTLTKSGTPADAKIVGDKFKEMQQSINEIKADIGEGGGSSFSGKASDVTYDDTETEIGADNVQDAIDKLSEDIGDLKGSGISTDLLDALKTYFTNMQTLLTQIAYVTENNLGNTVVQNAMDVVTVLENGTANPEQPTDGIVQLGSVLAITSGVTATQTGSVLAIA